MAKSIKSIVLFTLFTAAVIGSTAQTTHKVLDSQGWTIPPNGSATYTTWAANKSFTVGDSLMFNYTSGLHDVTEVTKEAYDNCDATNPISIQTNGPTNIRLESAGEHYFICSFNSHCSLGQKLKVNVTAAPGSPPASAPRSAITLPLASAPAPATNSPPCAIAPAPGTATPTPAPSRSPMTYTVGDGIGWTVPPGGAATYQTWTNDKSFMVGDILVFNFIIGTHNVAEVTKADYQSCNTSSTLALDVDPPVRVTLTTTGDHYFTCAMPRHCSLGQKLAIIVSGSSTAAPSDPSPTTSTNPPSSGNTPTTPSPNESTTPPMGSSATSLALTGLSATILSLAIALLY